jgi:adenine deaminase
LAEAAVCRGTACLVYDDLLLHLALGADRLAQLTGEISRRSLPHVFWVARMASQSRFEGEERFYARENIEPLLRRSEFCAIGELTRWTDLLDPQRASRLVEIMEAARAVGKFADGHTAGASVRRLVGLAAVGIRSCHEAITAEEALERLRQGFWVLLRHSSLRRDLVALLPALVKSGALHRFAYTTDGTQAHELEELGCTDHVIRVALGAGVPPNTAYRMATLNAAAYLRLEEDLGALAPGRLAHINLLDGLGNPTPQIVVCRGKVVARDGALTVPAPSESLDWEALFRGGEPTIPSWGPELFALPPEAPNPFPAAQLVNAVITRETPTPLTSREDGLWPVGDDLLVLALTDRSGRWVARGVLGGLAPGLGALATTYTTNAGVLVLGASPQAMAEALRLLREAGGGVVVIPATGEPQIFPLPLAGIHLPGGFADAARSARRFHQAISGCGYSHTDPIYTLLFLSSDFLPDLRAVQAGWLRVKTGEVLLPAQRLG